MSGDAAMIDPSPHANRVGLSHQIFGLAAAPIAWSVRLLVNLAVSSSACLPERPAQPTMPGIGGGSAVMMAIDITALIVALAGAALAYSDWRKTRAEMPGSEGHALEVGEGRARFLAISGVIASLGFALATLFDLTALLIVPLCDR